MYWLLPRGLNPSRCTWPERKTKGRRNETLTTSTDGSRSECFEISFTRTRLKWKRSASLLIFFFSESQAWKAMRRRGSFPFPRGPQSYYLRELWIDFVFQDRRKTTCQPPSRLIPGTWEIQRSYNRSSLNGTRLNGLTSAPAGYPGNVRLLPRWSSLSGAIVFSLFK